MIKTFSQFTNESEEVDLKKSKEEIEITINTIDKSKNFRNLLNFLKSSTVGLTIKCVDDESKEEKEFKWNKEDSILFLDVQEVEDSDENDKDLQNSDETELIEITDTE